MKGKIRSDAQGLLAEFKIPNGVEHPEPMVFIGIETIQCGSREEGFESIATSDSIRVDQNLTGIRERGVGTRAMDLRLYEDRLVTIFATGRREKMELMTISTRPMGGAIASCVEPERDSVRGTGLGRIADRAL